MFEGVPKSKPKKLGTMTTIDADGKVVSVKKNAATLLPPAPHLCQECAVDHAHNQPHNCQSLYYQTQFQATHGRWPTWSDAMAHCPPEVRTLWRTQLIKLMKSKGMEIPPDLMEQKPAGR